MPSIKEERCDIEGLLAPEMCFPSWRGEWRGVFDAEMVGGCRLCKLRRPGVDGELADADGLFLSAIPAIVNGGKTFRLSGLSAQNSDRHSEAMLCCRVVIADVIKQ